MIEDQPFTPAQVAQLTLIVKESIREELADAGLRLDGPDHQYEATADFRWVRSERQSAERIENDRFVARLRHAWDSAVVKTGTFILLGLLGIAATIAGMGFWAWINRGGN
jgi:hypothetical protein